MSRAGAHEPRGRPMSRAGVALLRTGRCVAFSHDGLTGMPPHQPFEGETMRLKISLSLATLAVAGPLAVYALSPASEPVETARAIDGPELASVVGGVSTDVLWPTQANWSQSYDNLRFQIAVENHYGEPTSSLIAGADGSKVGYATVATPAPNHTGSWHTRMMWPFPGKKQLQLLYVHDGQTFEAYGEPTLNDQGLLPNVKVHTVKFWNAVSPSMSTNVSTAISQGLVDNLNAAIPTRMTNVDGIYAESCDVSTKTQWRFVSAGTMNISDRCMDMVASGSTNASCVNELYSKYSNDPGNVHVVYIKRNEINGWAGAHFKSGAAYSITIRDDWENNADLDALLAHELGHTHMGGHTNGLPGIDCNLPRADRNLMCSNVGRIMNATQCATAEASNRYPDKN
jgi:hypothetical protein